MITNHHSDITGLSNEEVRRSREQYGANQLDFKKESAFLDALKSLAKEPMVILLLAASSIYFISGDVGDALFLAVSIVLVASISLYQDSRSRNALEKLKNFTQANCKVIRNGEIISVPTEDLVMGDALVAEEGTTIPADGTIQRANDFSINESILTGESFSVTKTATTSDNKVFRGTTVVSGLAVATVTAIGNQTAIGKIGKSLESITEEKTPLEIQISNFVKKMVVLGVLVFILVWAINYFRTHAVLGSLLNALTLAMSILPEEIPVAFTTFMALGAWRLMKMGIIVKQMKTVETLGSATVICTDKTGTITENKMSLAKIFSIRDSKITTLPSDLTPAERELIHLAMWASEPIPFDPMEVALHEAYFDTSPADERPQFQMIHEYPLDGIPPMMTHLFENAAGRRIIAAKGAPEALMAVSSLNSEEKQQVETAIQILATDGYRVLGVGEAIFEGNDFPKKQQHFTFEFKGLVAFYDPPKQNIQAVFDAFDAAGIRVKIITGDNAATTGAIAKQIGFRGYEKSMTGSELMRLSDADLQQSMHDINLFTRMFPEAKLRIINALKAQNEIVAMTGDGVNDGPALKAAHIGIAMGKRGTEIAKQAASLILQEDDLSKMVDAIAMGRKIYTNLKKAIQYVISIHIPIILTVFIPLALGWVYPNIFSPVHVILLELIMGPTCSIIYENEPMEKNTMIQKPRPLSSTFFSWKELMTSIIQGLMITAGVLLIYQLAVGEGYNEMVTRAMVFTTLMSSNIFLTLINRSFYYSIFTTLRYKNNLVLLVIALTIVLTALLLYVDILTRFFQFEHLNALQLVQSIVVGFLFVIWYEGVKWGKRMS
jgi:P-type Ca2+ transporter type 2C